MDRLTKQRKIILEELKSVKTHPDATELYSSVRKKIPNISLGTVYRNLEILSQEGKIVKISCVNFSRFDGYTEKHSHFLCKNCQRVYDIEQDTKLNFNQKGFEKKTGSKILGVNIEAYGICRDCKLEVKNDNRTKDSRF